MEIDISKFLILFILVTLRGGENLLRIHTEMY